MSAQPARYDIAQSYDWNYEHAPVAHPCNGALSAGSPKWKYAGLPAHSPVAIAAGPLLNGRWVLHYAALGFDVLTYKTVRSRFRACYPLPNLQPVRATQVNGAEAGLPAIDQMEGNWAVSFGMPSKAPDIWRADVERTRKALSKDKIMSVSVVATPEAHWTIEQVADDYALCAKWAAESGAGCVEANFSCPNVSSCDAHLYQQPALAALVAARLKQALGPIPLLIKIGHVTEPTLVTELARALAPHCQAIVMVNCISASVTGSAGKALFDGEPRGIAGPAIRQACLRQVALFGRVIREQGLAMEVIGVGGITSADDVREYLSAGCTAVQLATAGMLNPEIGQIIRDAMAGK